MKKFFLYAFFAIVLISLTTPLWVFTPLLFPYVTSKAFFFRICIELALPLYAYLVISEKSLRPKLKNWLNAAVLIFLAINIITSFTGVNVPRSLWGGFERMGGAYYLAHLVLLYFYIQLIGQLGGQYLKRFLQVFIAVALLVTINGLSGWVGGPVLILDPSLPARVSSTLGNPIFLGSYLIIPMFVSLYFAMQEDRRGWKIAYWISAFLLLLGIYSSDTRGAVVGLIVGVFLAAVLYVILTGHKKIKRYGFIGIALFVVIVGLLYANHGRIPATSKLSRLVNLNDSNTQARLIQWKVALRGFRDRPILGVGPENYYIIANQYYNPAIYKYDPSWFDKPHNYVLEILVTNGVFGLAAYAAMFGLALYGLWRGYKAGLLGLLEMCMLVAAMVSYQVQNLFVFDTVSASVTFYTFLGLAAYLWVESRRSQASGAEHRGAQNSSWAMGAAIGGAVAMLYIVYISNILSMEAATRVNYGYAYVPVNAQTSSEYFDSAMALPFNLDPRESVNRYSETLSNVVGGPNTNADPKFVAELVDRVTADQKKIAEKTQNDPLLWMRLAADEMYQAIVRGSDPSVAEPAIQKAISLAPKRAETWQVQLQLDGYTKNWKDAADVAEKIMQLNPYNPDFQWQVAMANQLNGNTAVAVRAGDEAVANGFKFTQLQQFAWYIQYYEDKKDYATVAPLLEQAIALQPNELGLYVDLAHTYANLGNYEKARLLAQQVETSDPTQKAAMDAFIKSLPK